MEYIAFFFHAVAIYQTFSLNTIYRRHTEFLDASLGSSMQGNPCSLDHVPFLPEVPWLFTVIFRDSRRSLLSTGDRNFLRLFLVDWIAHFTLSYLLCFGEFYLTRGSGEGINSQQGYSPCKANQRRIFNMKPLCQVIALPPGLQTSPTAQRPLHQVEFLSCLKSPVSAGG